MLKDKEIFWNEVRKIQETTVDTYLNSNNTDREELLNKVNFDIISGFIELLDGVKNKNIKGNIINLQSGNIINHHILLNDFYKNYLSPGEAFLYEKYNEMEDFLNEATFDTIYDITELLDGIKNENIKGKIINLQSGNIINNILLHDFCEDYLKYPDI